MINQDIGEGEAAKLLLLHMTQAMKNVLIPEQINVVSGETDRLLHEGMTKAIAIEKHMNG